MKTFFLSYKLYLVLHAGKKSSNYFPGWQKHNSLISWKKGEQKNSWLGVRFYDADPGWQVHFLIYG